MDILTKYGFIDKEEREIAQRALDNVPNGYRPEDILADLKLVKGTGIKQKQVVHSSGDNFSDPFVESYGYSGFAGKAGNDDPFELNENKKEIQEASDQFVKDSGSTDLKAGNRFLKDFKG